MIFRVAAGFFCLLFLLSAAVQYNDPDPWLWLAGYLIPAALSLVAALGRIRECFWPAAAGAVIYATLGALVFPGWITEWFGDEEFREAGGLWIVAGWLAVLAWRAHALRDSRSA